MEPVGTKKNPSGKAKKGAFGRKTIASRKRNDRDDDRGVRDDEGTHYLHFNLHIKTCFPLFPLSSSVDDPGRLRAPCEI